MIKRNVELEWKAHNVNVSAFEQWCRANSDCAGVSAHSKCVVHLTEDSQAQEDAIRAKWDELEDDQHEMVVSYKSRAQLEAQASARAEAIRLKKIGMLEKTWANMDSVERKLYLSLDSEVSDEALGL